MDERQAIKEGLVSKITKTVKEQVKAIDKFKIDEWPKGIDDHPEEIKRAYKTAAFVRNLKKLPVEPKQFKYDNFRTRKIDDLLENGYYPTCSDIGLLFRTLMIAQEVPTSYLETLHENAFIHGDHHGHIYARIFTKEGPYIADPTNYDGEYALFYDEQDLFANKRYVAVAEGRDHQDFGIKGWESWKKFKKERIAETTSTYERLLDQDYQQKKNIIQALRSAQSSQQF